MKCSYFWSYIVQVVLLFVCDGEMVSTVAMESPRAHCTQIDDRGLDFRPKNIVPKYVNASDSMELSYNMLKSSLSLEMCPNNVTLKVSWKMQNTSGTVTQLCIKITSPLNGSVLSTYCVKVDVEYSAHPVLMTCWFPMEYLPYFPMITAQATSPGSFKGVFFNGELNTSGIDLEDSCKDICEVSEMSIKSQISCDDTESILFEKNINVKYLSFDAVGTNSCRNSSILITSLNVNRLDYKLNCSHNGIGYIKVLYSINGKYCLKYQNVKVVCANSPQTTDITGTLPHVDDFKTFVIFGVVCMIIISVLLCVINLVAQKIRLHLKARRRYNRADLHLNGDNGVPLQTKSFRPREPTISESIPIPVDEVIKREYRKRVDSMSSTSECQNSISASSFKGQTVRQLHRCMTVALLENTETFYRKKIMFLPTPFDTFSRDATNLLKAVFTLELSIPTECCFDRDVFQRYMTGDRYKWIEAILGDYDRIIVFLCFTTIRGQQGESMVEDMLDHLPLSRIRPHCKVAFLHITDSSENLEKNHHGDSFHLSDKDSYVRFLCEIIRYCGKNPETETDIVCRLTSCEASKHFLNYIWMK